MPGDGSNKTRSILKKIDLTSLAGTDVLLDAESMMQVVGGIGHWGRGGCVPMPGPPLPPAPIPTLPPPMLPVPMVPAPRPKHPGFPSA
jgi:hypothetical protein